jgi:hypothetical protein
MMSGDDTLGAFGQLMELGNALRVVEAPPAVPMFLLNAAGTRDLWAEESSCSGTSADFDNRAVPMQWGHLNVVNKEYLIVFRRRRGRRVNEGTVHRVTPLREGRGKHFTQEFEVFALTLVLEVPEACRSESSVRATPG